MLQIKHWLSVMVLYYCFASDMWDQTNGRRYWNRKIHCPSFPFTFLTCT